MRHEGAYKSTTRSYCRYKVAYVSKERMRVEVSDTNNSPVVLFSIYMAKPEKPSHDSQCLCLSLAVGMSLILARDASFESRA